MRRNRILVLKMKLKALTQKSCAPKEENLTGKKTKCKYKMRHEQA